MLEGPQSCRRPSSFFLLYFFSESDPVRASGRYLIPVTLTAARRAKAIPSFCSFRSLARSREVERVQEKKGREGRRRLSVQLCRARVRACVQPPPHATFVDLRTHCELAFQFSVSLFFTFLPSVRPDSGENFNINTAVAAAQAEKEEAQLFLGDERRRLSHLVQFAHASGGDNSWQWLRKITTLRSSPPFTSFSLTCPC